MVVRRAERSRKEAKQRFDHNMVGEITIIVEESRKLN